MPHFVDEGSHETVGVNEESAVQFQRCRILPPIGSIGQLPEEIFVEGQEEDDEEPFCGMILCLLKFKRCHEFL
jgi:hypothetical protein